MVRIDCGRTSLFLFKNQKYSLKRRIGSSKKCHYRSGPLKFYPFLGEIIVRWHEKKIKCSNSFSRKTQCNDIYIRLYFQMSLQLVQIQRIEEGYGIFYKVIYLVLLLILIECKKDRAVILTTHSMEEADVLSQRIGIITNGQLRCLVI